MWIYIRVVHTVIREQHCHGWATELPTEREHKRMPEDPQQEQEAQTGLPSPAAAPLEELHLYARWKLVGIVNVSMCEAFLKILGTSTWSLTSLGLSCHFQLFVSHETEVQHGKVGTADSQDLQCRAAHKPWYLPTHVFPPIPISHKVIKVRSSAVA